MTAYPTCPSFESEVNKSERATAQRTWFVPKGKTHQQAAYCEECFHLFVRPSMLAASGGGQNVPAFEYLGGLRDAKCTYDRSTWTAGEVSISVRDALTDRPCLFCPP